MKDSCGREIEYMRISVTDRCNLRCRYCMPPGGVSSVRHDEILRFDEICRVVKCAAALGIHSFRITGGEPLVRKHLSVLAAMLHGMPGVRSLAVTTNGTLLAGEADALVRAGIDTFNISLDTADDDFYRFITRGGEIRDARRGIEAALAAGAKVRLNCVLLGVPEQDIASVARLAGAYGIPVRFIEMMPVGYGRDWKGFLSAEEAGRALTQIYGEPKALADFHPGHGPAEYWSYPPPAGKIGFIHAVSGAFCGGCNRVRLTAQGYFKTCLQYRDGADLRQILREGGAPSMDERLTEAMRNAILKKPERHHFEDSIRIRSGENGAADREKPSEIQNGDEALPMSGIGG